MAPEKDHRMTVSLCAYSKNSNIELYNRLTAFWQYLNRATLKSSIKILANKKLEN